jgi:RNA polymerase sigma factor (sigma-70 family)
MRTDAERHRLILDHDHLIPMVASTYRGARGVPFDELEGAGMVGLCEAAHGWRGEGEFVKYAHAAVRGRIVDFIRSWAVPGDPDEPDTGSERAFYEWDCWSDRDYSFALAEHWTKLPVSPDDLATQFEKIMGAGEAVHSAMIGLSRREREIMHARYFSAPPSTIESISRQHNISYARCVRLIDGMLKRIRGILEAREAA